MTHQFCQDATETLLKRLHSTGTVGSAISTDLQCQKRVQTSLRVIRVRKPGSTDLLCTGRFPHQGLRSRAQEPTHKHTHIGQPGELNQIGTQCPTPRFSRGNCLKTSLSASSSQSKAPTGGLKTSRKRTPRRHERNRFSCYRFCSGFPRKAPS